MADLLHLPDRHRPEGWDQRPNEPSDVWQIFLMYRDMAYPMGPAGPFKARNLKIIASNTGYERTEICLWASQHQWAVRAGAWDRYVQRSKDQQEIEDGIEQHRSKYSRLLQKLFAITEIEFDKLMVRVETIHEFSALETKDLLALAKFTWEAESKINQSLDPKDVSATPWDLSKLSNEEIKQLKALRQKAG